MMCLTRLIAVAVAGTAMMLTPAPDAFAQAAFAISTITVPKLRKDNLCNAIGGAGIIPTVTIAHSRVEGVPITVRMYDDLSDGRVYDHYSTTVTSSKSGITKVNYAFLPPCNTTGRLTSKYSFSAEGGGSKKAVVFGRYDSPQGKILP